ncbi:MAG: ABC transporter permease subunit [Deltaproteobacteria bacterium]|nr:ABC transporter permease subunit [Deltaproteobacteria bacterium]
MSLTVSPRKLLFVSLIALVGYLTLLPLFMVVFGTLRDAAPGTTASFTLSNYARAFGGVEILWLLANTVVFAVGASLLSLTIGTWLAWVTERTDTPLRRVIYFLVLAPFIVPGVLTAISWVMLLSPKVGLINWLAVNLLGFSEPPFNIYSMEGMIWAFGADNITLPFLLMAAAFRSMDPSLEEAAYASGMTPIRTFWHVNFKLMLPSIMAVSLLLFVRGLETFEAPAVIGIPAEIKVFSSQIYLALSVTYPPEYNLASTYAVVYLLVAVLGIVFYLRATSVTGKFTTITGRGFRPRKHSLGRWRYLTLGLSLIVLLILVVLPIAIVFWVSLLPFYAPPSRYLLSLMTVDNYRAIIQVGSFHRALVNNLVVGISSATIAVLLAATIAWFVVRTKFWGRRLLDVVAFTPIAIPGVVMGLALIWVYLTLPIPVYGTLWILGIAYVSKFIPIALRACHSAILQIHPELEEAAELSDRSWRRTFFRIVIPLILPGVLVGWFYVLTLTFKVLSLPILLSHVGTEVLPMVIYDLYSSGRFPEVCALGTILIGLLTILAGVSRMAAGRFGVQEG